jgi:hypothetical protein
LNRGRQRSDEFEPWIGQDFGDLIEPKIGATAGDEIRQRLRRRRQLIPNP